MPDIFVTADLHLGSTLSSCQNAATSHQTLLLALDSMLKTAANSGAKYFIIAGDIFDSPDTGAGLEQLVMDKIAAASPMTVLAVAGNHDPYDLSLFFKLKRPDNLVVFDDSFTRYEGETAVFYGVSCYEGKICGLVRPADDGKKARILIAHGELDGADDRFYPIPSRQIIECGYDYAVLGHIHARGEHILANGTKVLCPGIPVGRGYDEAGVKGFYSLKLSGRTIASEFIPIDCHRYYNLELDITGAKSTAEVTDAVRKTVLECGGNCSVRLTLTGFVVPGLQLDAQAVLAAALTPTLKQVKDLTKLDPASLCANSDTLSGRYCALLLEKRSTATPDQQEIIDKALKLGLDALS
jgi:DNA repair exonuclease